MASTYQFSNSNEYYPGNELDYLTDSPYSLISETDDSLFSLFDTQPFDTTQELNQNYINYDNFDQYNGVYGTKYPVTGMSKISSVEQESFHSPDQDLDESNWLQTWTQKESEKVEEAPFQTHEVHKPVINTKKQPKKMTSSTKQISSCCQSLQSVRTFNGRDDPRLFDSEGKYIFEFGPRAQLNAYEPTIIRRDTTNPSHGSFGLCPYCKEERFLAMKTSLYLHHMTVTHGVFSNGVIVKDPIIVKDEVIASNGKRNVFEFFKCPYNCHGKMKVKNCKSGNKYKIYLRHVKECHGCGKRDNQVKKNS